ncbi:AbrB family transcriptional regulator [Sulfolobus sp. SCGC AB-777_G06]|jgi:looped-hinge helix DNA binding domain, AbrB family|uniref:AbrB/MazE/SpoVT family DNA-binding domain-containing protein n=1 Tax=Stygiolobus sp. CP859M TaxID=3133135 RepID=UPI000D58424F|nr:AbrB family transcriptional regulator [Sulfolobus sp. SCGC AB-777_G06]
MKKEFILKIDDRGRITIPKEVRELLKSKRLKLKIEDGKIILEPVVLDVNKYYGIFKKDIGNEDIDEILNKALAEVLLNDKQGKIF